MTDPIRISDDQHNNAPAVPQGWTKAADQVPLEADGEVFIRFTDGSIGTGWATYWHGASNDFARWTFPDPDEFRLVSEWAKNVPASPGMHWTENEPVRLPQARTGRVYLAGPMTGISELNFPAFNQEAERLRADGLQVLNPADHGIVDGADWADYLRHDIAGLASCERIHLLRGWTKSKGACLEMTIAKALGMTVTYQVDAEMEHNNAPAVPQDMRLVPVWLLERVERSLGSFTSDEGWAQSDMDTMDSVSALLAATPAPAPAPAQEPETALQKFTRFKVAETEGNPVEMLRAFCAFAMNSQDWFDVEPFFDLVREAMASRTAVAPAQEVATLSLAAEDVHAAFTKNFPKSRISQAWINFAADIAQAIAARAAKPAQEVRLTDDQLKNLLWPIAEDIAKNCNSVSPLVFPYLFLGVKDLLEALRAKGGN